MRRDQGDKPDKQFVYIAVFRDALNIEKKELIFPQPLQTPAPTPTNVHIAY